MNRRFLILDCNYLCHRAKHSTGRLSFGGTPTGIIYGFLKTVQQLQEQFDTQHVLFCWDSKTNKRLELFPDYKKKRNNRHKEWTDEEAAFEKEFRLQMQKLRRIYLKKIGYRNVFCQKGYESDDLIASICLNLSIKDEAVIVTSDKDLYQCIRSNISFYSPQKGKELTLQGFSKLYGMPPIAWANVKAIAGCSTDEVPGVKGVGDLTAIKYMKNQLKETSKAFQNISSDKGVSIYERNRPLVVLPFEGVKNFNLKKDRISKEGYKEVIEELGFKSLKDKGPITKRKKKKRKLL